MFPLQPCFKKRKNMDWGTYETEGDVSSLYLVSSAPVVSAAIVEEA